MLINRIYAPVIELRSKQAGFKRGRDCLERIHVLTASNGELLQTTVATTSYICCRHSEALWRTIAIIAIA